MRIGELARRAGVSTDTVRLYERRGLLTSGRRANGYRDYPPRAEEVLRLIRLAQRLGFTLAEISSILVGLQSQQMDSDAVAAVLRDKIAQVEARAADLLALRDLMVARLADVCPLGLDRPDADVPVRSEANTDSDANRKGRL